MMAGVDGQPWRMPKGIMLESVECLGEVNRMSLIDFEDIDPTEKSDGPQQLWCAVLEALIDDAWAGARRGERASKEQRYAYIDVMASGPMLQWICGFTGYNPEAITDAFREQIEAMAV